MSQGLLYASIALYGISMPLPSLGLPEETLDGWQMVVLGFAVVFDGVVMPAWLANPAYVVALAVIARSTRGSPRRSGTPSFVSVLAVSAALAGLTWPMFASGAPLIGYYAWQASLILGCAAVLIASRPRRPPARSTQRYVAPRTACSPDAPATSPGSCGATRRPDRARHGTYAADME